MFRRQSRVIADGKQAAVFAAVGVLTAAAGKVRATKGVYVLVTKLGQARRRRRLPTSYSALRYSRPFAIVLCTRPGAAPEARGKLAVIS